SMNLNLLRKALAFFIAPLVPLAIAGGLTFAVNLPDAEFSWPWAIYVTIVSGILVGLPAISISRRRRHTSSGGFVAVGSTLSAGSAALGIIGLYLIDQLDQRPPALSPVESGLSWYGHSVLVF